MSGSQEQIKTLRKRYLALWGEALIAQDDATGKSLCKQAAEVESEIRQLKCGNCGACSACRIAARTTK